MDTCKEVFVVYVWREKVIVSLCFYLNIKCVLDMEERKFGPKILVLSELLLTQKKIRTQKFSDFDNVQN